MAEQKTNHHKSQESICLPTQQPNISYEKSLFGEMKKLLEDKIYKNRQHY